MDEHTLSCLYSSPLKATRIGPLFNAVSYPTKISPETVALFIASHTRPGDTVFDGFGGSCTTALGAMLCAHPTDSMIREAERLQLRVTWGVRRAIVYELGGIGAFIGRTLCAAPDPLVFRKAAEALLVQVEREWSWLYTAHDTSSGAGQMRYAIWSDVLICPTCEAATPLWNAAVSLAPARVASQFRCRSCAELVEVNLAQRQMETVHDDVLAHDITCRRRLLARVHGVTGRRQWVREPQVADLELVQRIGDIPLPRAVPLVEIPWGDLYRSGYHSGMTHLHHFYTRRNAIALGQLWDACQHVPGDIGDALRLWVLSYNASHSTIMTRVVAKQNSPDLVVTGAQPGVLYVSGLPVEKNLFMGLRRKIAVFTSAFTALHKARGYVQVVQGSSDAIDLPTGSVDYVFTDPPFGGNIPYSEINFLSEAWLGCRTDVSREAIVSPAQQKSVEDYEEILSACIREMARVLRDGGPMTVVFHSAQARVWKALVRACEGAGLTVERTSVLEKTQGSFKQVTTRGAVKGDPTILFAKRLNGMAATSDRDWVSVTRELVYSALRDDNPRERTPQRIYSRLINHYLGRHVAPPVDAAQFYDLLEAQFMKGGALAVAD